MENVTLIGFLQFVVLFSAAATAIVGALVKGARWLRKELSDLIQAEIPAQLEGIKKELSPNSGTSLRDKVNEIAKGFESLQRADTQRHKENTDRLNRQQRQIDAIRRTLIPVLKAAKKSGNAEAPIPGLTDELLSDLDDADERKGHYRRERWSREEDE